MELGGAKYLAKFQTSAAIRVSRAEEVYIYDEKGRKFIDLVAGGGVLTTGYSHPAVVETISSLTKKGLHLAATIFSTEYMAKTAEKLAILAPGAANRRVIFTGSGKEAVRIASDIARKYTCREPVLRLKLDEAMIFQELPAQTLVVSPTNELVDAVAEKLQAIGIPEPAALIFDPLDFLKFDMKAQLMDLKELADEKKFILIADETRIMPGIVGEPLAVESLGFLTDILVLGEAVASGLPFGAVVLKPSIENEADGIRISTSASVLSVAVAHTTMELVEMELSEKVQSLEQFLEEKLKEIADDFGDRIRIYRVGQFIEIRPFFPKRHMLKALSLELLHKGIWIGLPRETAIVLMPSLIIKKQDFEKALTAIHEILGVILSNI